MAFWVDCPITETSLKDLVEITAALVLFVTIHSAAYMFLTNSTGVPLAIVTVSVLFFSVIMVYYGIAINEDESRVKLEAQWYGALFCGIASLGLCGFEVWLRMHTESPSEVAYSNLLM